MIKLLRLFIVSVLILLFAWWLQPTFEHDHGIVVSQAEPTSTVATSPHKPTWHSRPLSVSSPLPSPTPWPTRTNTDEPAPLPTPTPKPTLPRITRHAPARNALLNDLHTPLVFTFDNRYSGVEYPLHITPTVQGQLTWRDDHTLVFTPYPGWTPDTRYEVRLRDDWKTWFRTRRLVETTTPTGVAVAPQKSIIVRFGFPVDRTSVENAFTISPTVAGRFRWTDDRRFVFKHNQPLDHLTTYHVSFNGPLRDAPGMPLPDPNGWVFTTRSLLISVQPRSQSQVSVESTIQIKFDTPVDQTSVEAALTITPSVSGSFDWRGNVLTFTPTDHWDPNTTYDASLNASIRTAAGRPVMADDYRWRFNTQSIPRTVDFGHGPNVQVLDADGRRAVQLTSYRARPTTSRLYALDIPQFLDRYTSAFRGVGPDEHKSIKTSDLPLAFTWEQTLSGRPAEIVIPASVSPGLYVLQAQSGSGQDQIIVVLTRYTLVLKQAERQIVTWASTMSSSDHAPAAAMHLRFYDRDGTLVAEGATEERGLHRAVLSVDTEPLIVIGELDGDITVSGLGHEWQATNNRWWGWWKTSPSAPNATIYPYTDRPIYRPGQTVHARAVVRRDDDAVYGLPDGVEVVLRLRDARDNIIATRQRTPDEFGAVYADFEIADGGTVGDYHLEISALDESVSQSFLVEAYRKPDYEVTLTPASDHVIVGEPLTLTVQANYFFGPPVAGARVELLPYVVSYDEWYNGGTLDYGYAYEKLRRSGRTDANGRYTVVLPAGVTNDRKWQTWNIQATVTDASNLSVSGHAAVVVHRAAFGLNLHTDRYHYRPGEPILVTLLARDHLSQNAPGGLSNPLRASNAELSVGLYAWNWNGARYDQLVVETTTTTDGRAEVTLQTTQSGWYKLWAKGADSAGRKIQSWRRVLVYDAGSSDLWDTGQGGELRLSTDRDRYAPGDSVSLLIESPVGGPALLSFERATVRRETVIQLDEGLNTLEFALLPDDAPNVHVAVAVWRPTQDDDRWQWQSRPEQELLTAHTEILVPADDKQLTVTIMPDRDQYAPRDQAVFVVEIRDAAGQPAQAGFSLALVDEAIYALAADQTPDIFDAFYRPRPDIVRTYHSSSPIRWLGGGRGGGGGDGGAALGGSPRSDFPDTAFWAPALTTDADGRAVVHVLLPDSLTSWRAVVRAVTIDTKVGQATANVTVALPLSIRPLLPRFLVRGDQATLRAVIHNHTGEKQVATVRLSPTGLKLDEALSATQQITLPANGTVAVDWAVTADRLGEAGVRMDVTLQENGWHDAVALSLPVVPLAIPQVDTVATEVKGEWIETITLPNAAIPDVSRWELAFAPSIATGMLDGLEFLIDYPFG